jgi:hypothetical protein
MRNGQADQADDQADAYLVSLIFPKASFHTVGAKIRRSM